MSSTSDLAGQLVELISSYSPAISSLVITSCFTSPAHLQDPTTADTEELVEVEPAPPSAGAANGNGNGGTADSNVKLIEEALQTLKAREEVEGDGRC